MTTTSSDPAAGLRRLDTQLPTGRYLADMWARRDFVLAMPVEQLRVAHQDTLLGNVWHLGNPLLTTAVYYFVFGVLLGVSRGVDNFILWLMVGVFAFGLTSRTIIGGATAITSNRGLMRAIRFPRALLPVSVVISRLLTFGFQLAVIGVVAVATGEGISRRWLVLPVVLLVHTAFNMGGAFIAARLNDAVRDVQQILPFIFRLLTYMSGVMFPIDAAPRHRRHPADREHAVRASTRSCRCSTCTAGCSSATPMAFGDVLYGIVAAGVMLTFGFWYFRAAELRYGRA